MIKKLNENVDIQKLEQRIDDVINDVKDLYESSGRLNDAFVQNKSDGSPAYEKVILKLLSCTNMLSPIWHRIHHCLKETFPDYRMPKIGESKSGTRKRSIKEDIEQVDGYAVQIHDMGKGYVHLLLFNDESTAEEVLESLEYLESAEDMDEEMFYAEIDYNVELADDVVNEIDWRREVDNNDVWTASDDTKYKIVGSVDLWLYW